MRNSKLARLPILEEFIAESKGDKIEFWVATQPTKDSTLADI